jgi:hypothetical protein
MVLPLVCPVGAQVQLSNFQKGEAERVYTLLDALGCIDNTSCAFGDFKPTDGCGAEHSDYRMVCVNGLLADL